MVNDSILIAGCSGLLCCLGVADAGAVGNTGLAGLWQIQVL